MSADTNTEILSAMSEKMPQPLVPPRLHNCCPVCGKISYSRDGIHPQCAVRQEDALRTSRIKREELSAQARKPPTPVSGIQPWQKLCPKCNAMQHARKLVCTCGHPFTVKRRPQTGKDEPPSS